MDRDQMRRELLTYTDYTITPTRAAPPADLKPADREMLTARLRTILVEVREPATPVERRRTAIFECRHLLRLLGGDQARTEFDAWLERRRLCDD